MKGLFSLMAVALVAVWLSSFPSVGQAGEKGNALPPRVEGNQVNPPAPIFTAAESRQAQQDAAERDRLIQSVVENRFALVGPNPATPVSTTVAAALPGQPAQKLVRGGRKVLRFLFRGRCGRGGCG